MSLPCGRSPRSGDAIRVLMFMEFLPESEDARIMGGIEGRCFYVAKWLRQRHELLLLTDPTGAARWTHAAAGSVPRRFWNMLRALLRGLRSDFDIIDSTSSVTHPFAWLLAKLRRKPVVFWYPDVLIGDWRGGHFGWIGSVAEVVERLTLKLPVDRYIAISESTRTKLIAHGVRETRIDVVPCGYEPVAIQNVIGGSPPPVRRPGHVAVVNRLVPYKRVDLLIDAVSLLADTRPELEVTVVGSGPEHDRLVARAQAKGVGGRFRFTGLVESHLDVLRTIAEADLFVSCSEIEGFGIVVVEAMALSTPFVVTDIPAFREVTDGGTGGVLFRPGDAAELAKSIDTLMSDPDRARELGTQGRDHAARYTWEAVAQGTEAVYRDVLHNGRSARS